MESIPEENRVYIDEAGSNLAMTPSKAWSMRNHRAYDTKPARRGGNLSLVGALKKSGMPALYPYDGAVDSERFIDFIERCLQPNLNHDDVLIMDNCRIHHSKVVKRCMEELSIKVLYLPPYSPELNPIEEAWSVIKGRLKRKKARNILDYIESMIEAKESMAPEKCSGFFKHSASFQKLG